MAQKVRKAVIPVAGLGTRFLPATKTVPKELLPIVDRPILLYIVEECLRAGLHEIVFIQGRGKNAIEDFFDRSVELEDLLEQTGKSDLLKLIKDIRSMIQVISVRQKEALGLGHAVGMAKAVVGSEPFAVLLGDELMLPADSGPSAIGQLCEMYESTGLSTVAVMEVAASEVSKYGIVDAQPVQGTSWRVRSVVEKPAPERAPSRLALPGRYVFTPALFAHLEKTRPGKNGEIQLTDAMTGLAQNEGLMAMTVRGRRFDAGDKLGYLMANVELGLEHPEIGPAFRTYLSSVLSK